jgi:hypothetical protein
MSGKCHSTSLQANIVQNENLYISALGTPCTSTISRNRPLKDFNSFVPSELYRYTASLSRVEIALQYIAKKEQNRSGKGF